MSTSRSRELSEVFATLRRSQASLSLDHRDLCFLVALHVHQQRSPQGSLSEEVLRDVFERTWEFVEPDALNVQKAATERIGKLRDQRLLNRLAGSKYASDSDYALSSLALAVVTFFFEDDRLTRESLDVLTGTLEVELLGILQALRSESAEEYPRRVLGPLQVSASTLLEGIANRQRGLDREQENLRELIAEEMDRSTQEALDHSSELLDQMGQTLAELNKVLMQGTVRLEDHIESISELAEVLDTPDILAAATDVADKLFRVRAWGRSRLDTWSEFHAYVHRKIRVVINLDPNRALSQALRELLREGPDWRLRHSRPSRYRWLQEPKLVSAPVLIQQDEQPDRELETVEAEPLEGRVERAVKRALAEGPVTYLQMANLLLPETPRRTQFAMLGELAKQLGKHGQVKRRDASWHPLERFELNDWEVDPR